jgi:hypothetical protein
MYCNEGKTFYYGKDSPFCPFCSHDIEEEYFCTDIEDDGDTRTHTCEKCGSIFEVTIGIRVTYDIKGITKASFKVNEEPEPDDPDRPFTSKTTLELF